MEDMHTLVLFLFSLRHSYGQIQRGRGHMQSRKNHYWPVNKYFNWCITLSRTPGLEIAIWKGWKCILKELPHLKEGQGWKFAPPGRFTIKKKCAATYLFNNFTVSRMESQKKTWNSRIPKMSHLRDNPSYIQYRKQRPSKENGSRTKMTWTKCWELFPILGPKSG